jgi:hypothetical protein
MSKSIMDEKRSDGHEGLQHWQLVLDEMPGELFFRHASMQQQ